VIDGIGNGGRGDFGNGILMSIAGMFAFSPGIAGCFGKLGIAIDGIGNGGTGNFGNGILIATAGMFALTVGMLGTLGGFGSVSEGNGNGGVGTFGTGNEANLQLLTTTPLQLAQVSSQGPPPAPPTSTCPGPAKPLGKPCSGSEAGRARRAECVRSRRAHPDGGNRETYARRSPTSSRVLAKHRPNAIEHARAQAPRD
jgi:hypothetical protein